MTTARSELEAVGDEVQELTRGLEDMGVDARAETANALAEIERETRDIDERLSELAETSADEAEEAREELSTALAQLSAKVWRHLFLAEQELSGTH